MENKQFYLLVTFHAKPGQREAFLRGLVTGGVLDAIRGETGCQRYDFYLSAQDENELLLVERWESQAHQQVHMTQPHMAAMKQLEEQNIESVELTVYEVQEDAV